MDITPTITPTINTVTVRPAVAPDDKLLLLLSSTTLHVLVGQGTVEKRTDGAMGDVAETVAMEDCALTMGGAIPVVLVVALVPSVVIETPAVTDAVEIVRDVVLETVIGVVIETIVMVGCTLLGQVVLGGDLINGTIFSSPSVMMTSPPLTFSINNETTSSRDTAFIFLE